MLQINNLQETKSMKTMKTMKNMKNMELCLYISIKGVYNSVVFLTQEIKSSKIIFILHSKNFIDKNKTLKNKYALPTDNKTSRPDRRCLLIIFKMYRQFLIRSRVYSSLVIPK